MTDRRAWVVRPGGRGRSYLEYFLARKCACVGWGNVSGDLSGWRAEYPDRLNKESQKELRSKLKKKVAGIDPKAATPLRHTVNVRAGDLLFMARWPFVGEVANEPYRYDPTCTIGGWDLHHHIQVESWRRIPEKWEPSDSQEMKKWPRGPTIAKTNFESIEEISSEMQEWKEVSLEVPWVISLERNRFELLKENSPDSPAAWPEEYVLLDLESQNADSVWRQAWKGIEFDRNQSESVILENVIKPVLKNIIGQKATLQIDFLPEQHEMDSYIPCTKCSQPRVVIEAKKPSKSIYTEGIHRQIRRYAHRSLLVWQNTECDHNCRENRLFVASNGRHWRFFRLVAKEDPLCEMLNIHYDLEGNARMWVLKGKEATLLHMLKSI